MSSSRVDYSDYKSIAPPFDEPPRERGCFFYGCIIALVLAVLLLIAVGVISFLVYRWVSNTVETYTSTAPRTLPTLEMPSERRAAVKSRFDTFTGALEAGRPTAPLVLTSDDLNALIENDPNLKGKVFATIEDDRLKGQVSLPLDALPTGGLTRGRYLNGEAEFKVRLLDGALFITISYLEVNGQRASEEFMESIKGHNLLQETRKNSSNPSGSAERKFDNAISKLQSIEIRDGKMIITPRPPAASATGPTHGADSLPEDVLAPP